MKTAESDVVIVETKNFRAESDKSQSSPVRADKNALRGEFYLPDTGGRFESRCERLLFYFCFYEGSSLLVYFSFGSPRVCYASFYYFSFLFNLIHESSFSLYVVGLLRW